MDRKSNEPGSSKKASAAASSAAAAQAANQAALASEQSLAELFAAHNLLASSGMQAHNSNPLALLQQQMNMQYASPAAWWYLEYLSRIQAAQMVPNLQGGAGPGGGGGGGGGGGSGRDRERDRDREQPQSTSTGGGGGGGGRGNKSDAAHSNSTPHQGRGSGSRKNNNSDKTDGGGPSKPASRRGRGGAHANAHTHSHAQSTPVPQAPPPPSRMDQSSALNLSKHTPKPAPAPPHAPPPKPPLSLPSSVTIIPHAHSKPDSLTSPRFPSDFVPKPAHISKPSLYSHIIPKSPQVGLVKGERVKRKSTVASLLQQSRAGMGGGVEILPKEPKGAEKGLGGRAQSSPLALPRTTPEKVAPTSSTPPHRPWLNSTELNIPQPKPKAEPDLTAPLQNGWKRETILKGLGTHGLNGDVSYVSPNNVTVKSMQELKKLVGNNGLKNYSFSSKLLLGDFLLPSEDGAVLRLTSTQLTNWLKDESRESKKEEERIKGERERKKEHAGLVRALELFRRSRRRYKLQQERKLRKRAESSQEAPEVKAEPVEIDEVLAERKLKELEEIKGLRLGPEAFGNMLHIYEFLHTFGNTLGFDMESLPTLSNLQKAFLHIDENEEELLSVLSHLLVCAVEDPGMPNPNKHMTAFGQTLKQADITFGSLSEVLRLYLSAVSDSEPEAEKYSAWLTEAPFLALSPTRKSSIISFICDLLLQNKAVLKHLETSTESAHSAKKERQQNEIKIRRLRLLCARKTVAAVAAENEKVDEEEMEPRQEESEVEIKVEPNPEAAPEAELEALGLSGSLKEELMEVQESQVKVEEPPSMAVEIKKEIPEVKVQVKSEEAEIEPGDLAEADKVIPSPFPLPSDTSLSISLDAVALDPDFKLDGKLVPPTEDDASFLASSSSEESDSDAKLSIEEIRSKMTTLQRATEKLKTVQSSCTRVIRSVCLGQDRYRRRYWNLPTAGGIYIEGGASGEFEDLRARVKVKLESGESLPGPDPKPPTPLAPTLPMPTEPKPDAEEEEGAEDDKSKEAFSVPPPCIKIFSFLPRDGCSGKTRDPAVKEEEAEKAEDENFLSVVQEKHWKGWWKLESLQEFLPDLCSTGIREGGLKTILSNLSSPPALVEDELEDDEIPLNVHSPASGWDPELAYKVHLQLLETMETLEERVASASLQVKGWQLPTRPGSDLSEAQIIQIVKDRLLDLESAVERRYLKPPLGKSSHDLNLANLGDGADNYVGSRALTHWRDAIAKTTTPSILSMAIYTLDSSIAWDKSVMKASCQLCKGGDNEDQLLLCDACDRGYHTYCFKPPLETIPEGDWFCYECINKATGVKGCIVCGKGGGKILACDKCVKAFHVDCIQPQLPKVPRGRWHCPDHKSPSKNKRKSDCDSGTAGPSKKSNKKTKSEMAWCEKLLDDLMKHEDAWPFLEPVNTRQFPTYKKIIKSPMDLASIRARMPTYKTRLEFLADLRLIFDNCLTFNEDDSPVGKAGHNLRLFFEAASSKF